MLRIGQVEATATQDGKYTDGSVAGGIAATRLRAAAFNAMQEELAHIVESAGLALDINDMTQVLKAIQKLTLSRANPFADIKSDGTVKTALENLDLGEAAKRNVGTGAGQIPDMSSFGISLQNHGWAKFPSGLIIQWGNTPVGSTERSITYPIPYPTNVILVTHFDAGWDSASNGSKWGATNKTQTGFTANTDTALEGGQYFSMGY
ncbi:hypothetical protein HRZ53_004085 [Escherichia coli]|nr:hypothetical protein [Escherichia coli]